MESPLTFKQVELFKQRLVAYNRISEEGLLYGGEVFVEHVHKDLSAILERKIWSGDTQYVYYSEAKTWWDMFKETYFPTWLKAKFPPKYEQRKIDVVPYFPDMKLVSNGYKCTLVFRQF